MGEEIVIEKTVISVLSREANRSMTARYLNMALAEGLSAHQCGRKREVRSETFPPIQRIRMRSAPRKSPIS